jgi:hypothetical protein
MVAAEDKGRLARCNLAGSCSFIRHVRAWVHDARPGRSYMKNRILMVVALGLSMTLVGCKSDCRASCEKKQECVSSNLNVEECSQTCEQKAKEDKEFSSQAKACADCTKGKACSETMKQCLDECISVVGF